MSNNSIVEHRANYHFVALREEYLLICQQCQYKKPDTPKSKNKASAHCKALILDILEHWTNTKRDRRENLAIYMTYKQWSDSMYGMFGRNVIIDSLDELIGEGLVVREPYKMFGKDTFQYFLNYQELNRRMKVLPEKAPDKLLPQRDAFTNKRENDNTHLQVNGNAFTNKPVTRLQINEDAFTSNHNLDTTEIPNTNSTEEGLHFHATLTPDQQRIHYFYCQIVSSEPKVTEDLKKHWTALARRIKTQEEMNSLYEHSKKCILADDSKKIKKVYPGNLAGDVDAWVNEREAQTFELPGPTEMPEPAQAIYREHVPLPVDMREWMIETALEFGGDEPACVNELEWCFQHTTCSEENFYSRLIHAYEKASREKSMDILFATLKQDLLLVVEAMVM